jgi:hypothetical protein
MGHRRNIALEWRIMSFSSDAQIHDHTASELKSPVDVLVFNVRGQIVMTEDTYLAPIRLAEPIHFSQTNCQAPVARMRSIPRAGD